MTRLALSVAAAEDIRDTVQPRRPGGCGRHGRQMVAAETLGEFRYL